MESQNFRQAIDSIVSVLPQTLTRLIVSAIPLPNGARIPVQLKTLRADPRVVFILLTPHVLDAVEESYERTRKTETRT